jgi:hypothetical protein
MEDSGELSRVDRMRDWRASGVGAGPDMSCCSCLASISNADSITVFSSLVCCLLGGCRRV